MDVLSVDYRTILLYGTDEDLEKKLALERKTLDEVINEVDEWGVSLLEDCLCTKYQFEYAKRLLEKNAKVNNVTKEGNNEFHCLAANIGFEGGCELAWMLLERGTSLMHQDKKYGNPAFFTLCYEVYKASVWSPELQKFMEACCEKVEDFEVCNRAGVSIKDFINIIGDERLKEIMEAKLCSKE